MSDTAKSNDTEKVRFERLRLVARRALEELIKKSLTMDQVKTCFPTLVGSEDGIISLESALSQMSGFWHSSSIDEFDLIYKEKDMESKLDELDEIIQHAQERKDAGKQPSNIDQLLPLEIVDSTIMNNSNEVLDNLQMIYDQLCAENVELYNEFTGTLKKSNEIHTSIQSSLGQIRKEEESCDLAKEGIPFDQIIKRLDI